jgi:hypothetical protein
MGPSKAMHNDVFPTLTHQMQGKTFNISFSETHGVQFESLRCTMPITVSRCSQYRTNSNNSPVYLNNALSAFEKALPFIQDLNVTIELE